MAYLHRLLFFGFLMGVGLIVLGGYDFFIQAGTSQTPTTVSIEDLERRFPSNRHLIITGARLVPEGGVVYYETRRGAGKLPGSEETYYPVQDAALAGYSSFTPRVLLRITEPHMDAIEEGTKTFDETAIRGVRMTKWNLKGKAKDLLVQRYGEAAVKRMVILDWEKETTGVLKPLVTVLVGIGIVIGAPVLGRMAGRSEEVPNLRSPVPPSAKIKSP